MNFFSRKYKVINSSLFKGRTDIHCHILPGIDDGSKNLEQSLNLLNYLKSIGFNHVIFTPHVMSSYPNNNYDVLSSKFTDFESSYKKDKNNTLQLKLAAEYMLDSDFLSKYNKQTLNFKNKYILVETSYYNPPMSLYDLLFQITSDGFTPILAHPERYLYMNKDDYINLKKTCLFQLNLLSLSGYYGKSALEKSKKLLTQGMYNFVGSDIHHLEYYKDYMNNFKVTKSELNKLSTLYDNNEKLW